MDNDYILDKLERIEMLPVFPNISEEALSIIGYLPVCALQRISMEYPERFRKTFFK